MKTQHCNTCGQDKTIEEFYTSHKTRCKSCYKARQHTYYETMTEKKWQSHLVTCTKYSKKYRTNPARMKLFRDRARKRYHEMKHLPEYQANRRAAAKRAYNKLRADPVRWRAFCQDQARRQRKP